MFDLIGMLLTVAVPGYLAWQYGKTVKHVRELDHVIKLQADVLLELALVTQDLIAKQKKPLGMGPTEAELTQLFNELSQS